MRAVSVTRVTWNCLIGRPDEFSLISSERDVLFWCCDDSDEVFVTVLLFTVIKGADRLRWRQKKSLHFHEIQD